MLVDVSARSRSRLHDPPPRAARPGLRSLARARWRGCSRRSKIRASKFASIPAARSTCYFAIIRNCRSRRSGSGPPSTANCPCRNPSGRAIACWIAAIRGTPTGSSTTQLQGRADRNLEHLFTLLVAAAARRCGPHRVPRAAYRRPAAQRRRPSNTSRAPLRPPRAVRSCNCWKPTPRAASGPPRRTGHWTRLMQSQAQISRSLSLPAQPAKDTASRAPLP